MYTHTCLQNCTGQAHHALVPAIIQSPTPEQRMPHACSEEVVFTTISSSATSFYSVASSYSLQEITSLSRQGAVNTRFRTDLPQRNSSRPRCARENKPPRDRGFGCPPKTRSPGGWVFRGIVADSPKSQVSRTRSQRVSRCGVYPRGMLSCRNAPVAGTHLCLGACFREPQYSGRRLGRRRHRRC